MKKENLNSSDIIFYFENTLISDFNTNRKSFGDVIDYLNNNFNSFDNGSMFSIIHSSRLIIYKFLDENEKSTIYNLVSKFINKKNNEFLPQMVEFCGVIYKCMTIEIRRDIFDLVDGVCDILIKSDRGIVAYLTFVKYTNKSYIPAQLDVVNEKIKNIESIANSEMFDTIEYAKNNIVANFKPNRANVLLFIPELLSGSSFLQPPLCCIKIYKELKENGISVDLFDNRIYNYSIDRVIDLISNKYDYVIVSSTPIDQVQNYFVDHRFIAFCDSVRAINEKAGAKKLIVCGSHGTVDYKMLLKDISADIVIQGEYDCTVTSVMKHLILGEHDKGLIIRSYNDTQIISKANTSEWENSVLDFSCIDIRDYFGYRYVNNLHLKKQRWAILQTTRGCPYSCTFCYNMYGKNVRYKNINSVVEELKQLEAVKCKEIFFIDQTFTISEKYTIELCEKIVQEGISIEWQCETRVDCLSKSVVEAMKKAGCVGIWLGIESFDENVLKICKKGYTLSQLERSIDLLAECDVDYRAFIMLGMQGETVESLNNTISTIENKKIKLSKSIIRFTPRIGTEYYKNVEKDFEVTIQHFWQMRLAQNSANSLNENDITGAIRKLLLLTNYEDNMFDYDLLLIDPPLSYFNEENDDVSSLLEIQETPYVTFNPGLLSIGSYVMEKGYTVKIKHIIDDKTVDEKLNEIYKWGTPRVIGISCSYFQTYDTVLYLCDELSKRFNDSIIFVGGQHIGNIPGYALTDSKSIDFVIIGEGEDSTLRFLDFFVNGKGSIGEIKGIAFSERFINRGYDIDYANFEECEIIDFIDDTKNQVILLDNVYISKESYVPIDLDEMPFLKYDLYENYLTYPCYIEESRGCYGQCHYCVAPVHKNFRYKSAKRFLEELDYAVNIYGIDNNYPFLASNFGVNVENTVKIFKGILEKYGTKLRWNAEFRVDLKWEEYIDLMYKAGCRGFNIGMDSPSCEILSIMKKCDDTADYLKKTTSLIEHIAKYKDAAICVNMMFYVGETPASIVNVIDFISKNYDVVSAVHYSPTNLYYGTNAWKSFNEYNEKYGTRIVKSSYFDRVHVYPIHPSKYFSNDEANYWCRIIEKLFSEKELFAEYHTNRITRDGNGYFSEEDKINMSKMYYDNKVD